MLAGQFILETTRFICKHEITLIILFFISMYICPLNV